MINCSTELHFLKSGAELEAAIHHAIDETIRLTFEHQELPQDITPSQVTSKTNIPLVFYKYFHNHQRTKTVKFDDKWCRSLFNISLEEQVNYSGFNSVVALLPALKDDEKVTKTLYKNCKSCLRLFFYILWAQRAVLLPFYYKPPKARGADKSSWVEVGLPLYPETLRLIRNIHFKDERYEDFSTHLTTGENFVKDFGYQCVIASTWHSIEDIEVDDITAFKEFYHNLRTQDVSYAGKIKTLPFLAILKGFLSYAPYRCRFEINDLNKICLNQPGNITNDLFSLEIEEFVFEANLTSKLKILLTDDALESAAVKALRGTFDAMLSRHYNKNVTFGTHGERDYKTPRLGFLYAFEDVKGLTLPDLVQLYELIDHDYITQKDIAPYLAKGKSLDFWTEEYSDNFKSGLKVFFLELYSARAILLSMDFVRPKARNKDYSEGRYPELLRVLLNYKKHLKPDDYDDFESLGILYRAIIASNWRNVEDIHLSDAFEYQRMHQHKKKLNHKNLNFRLLDLLILVYRYAPDRCNYTLDELSQELSDIDPAKLLRSKELKKTSNQTGKKWITLARQYLTERKAQGYKESSGIKSALGKFIQHICVDLPRELEHDSKLVPQLPNQFTRANFVGNWRIPGVKEKLLMAVGSDVFNAHLRDLSAFFDWILIQSEDPDIAGFINPISSLDYRVTSRRKGTNKAAFPRRQFAHIHSFISAICEFYWYLIREEKFISGASLRRDVYDTQKVGYVPLVLIEGKLQPIYFVPANLTYEVTSKRNEIAFNYPTFQILFEPLIALETGLRHLHIRWLDREKFDVSNHQNTSSSNDYISELHVHYCDTGNSAAIEVGTDKVKTEPWNPYVSSRVLNLLRRIKAFQDSLDIEVPALWYDGHEGSIHGKIKSLFCSMDATIQVPQVISEDSYRSQYKRLLCFYDVFVQLSELDVPLLGITSTKALNQIDKAFKQAREELTADPSLSGQSFRVRVWEIGIRPAFYFNAQYKTKYKPHGTRSSVASEKVKVLPPHAIQKYITGHESRAVLSYYVQVDPEWLTEVEDYNESIFLSETHLKKTSNENLSEAQKMRTHEKLKRVVEQDPTLLSSDYGAVGFTVETSKDNYEGGLKTIAITPVSNLAFMPTHICPFGGVCPKDIKSEFGEYQCGQCYYSVKTVDHIPRILAHMRKLNDDLSEKTNSIVQVAEAGADVEALEIMENEKVHIANELAAWVYSYELLYTNLAQLKDKCAENPQDFLVERPDVLMQHFVEGKVEDNPVNALLLRIQDANAFQEYYTPQLKAQITQLRNKILIKHKQFDQLLQQPQGFDLLDEFKGILRAFTETQGISLAETAKRLSEPMRKPENDIQLLEMLNG